MKTNFLNLACVTCLALAGAMRGQAAAAAETAPLEIGSRLEPLVDDHLIETMDGLALKLHQPTVKDRAIVFDKPWGALGDYSVVFQDGDRYRMYYGCGAPTECLTAYAESTDGKRWVEPNLGLVEYRGSKQNSLVLDTKMWEGAGSHALVPFIDTNPDHAAEARYKAVAIGKTDKPAADLSPAERRQWKIGWTSALYAFRSPDGLRWTLMQQEPIITKGGSFDSQNVAFWDTVRGRYVCFYREFINSQGQVHRSGSDRHRVIRTATSKDFLHWTEPVLLDYGKDALLEHSYVNCITTMPGAPHVFVGFPQRLMPGRETQPDYPHPDSSRRLKWKDGDRVRRDANCVQASDTSFMTSRDGLHWHRWREAFIRPGLQPERWAEPHFNNAVAWGILRTKADVPNTPDEWSIYSHECDDKDPDRGAYRRFTIRQCGFVSVHAPATHTQYLQHEAHAPAAPASWTGGRLLTKPLIFAGKSLVINYSTSAAGVVLVEIQQADGTPIPGYGLNQCEIIFGDHVDRVVSWKGSGSDLSHLAGRPIRLRFLLNDADLYSLQFRP